MNPSTSDKSSVFSNEERKLSDIELGSVGGKGSRRSGSKRKNSKRESSASREQRRTSELVPVNQSDINESRARASSGTANELVATNTKAEST